jgi:hypothetical protein
MPLMAACVARPSSSTPGGAAADIVNALAGVVDGDDRKHEAPVQLA